MASAVSPTLAHNRSGSVALNQSLTCGSGSPRRLNSERTLMSRRNPLTSQPDGRSPAVFPSRVQNRQMGTPTGSPRDSCGACAGVPVLPWISCARRRQPARLLRQPNENVRAGFLRRGVVFVREVVPRWAIAKVAQVCFGENYIALPMRHKVIEATSEGGRIQAEYRWRRGRKWNSVRAECAGRPALPAGDSRESFFAEHYWGYAAQSDGGTVEYRVEHDRWRVWPATVATFEGGAEIGRA